MQEHALHMDDLQEAMSIKYNNQVYELKQKGEDVITLSYGEAYFDVPLYSFEDLPTPQVFHYSHSRGIDGLRGKLAGMYDKRYGVPVDPATEIIITAGSKIAIYMALLAILNPGDEVVIPEPTWVSYTEQIKLCHGKPVMVPYNKSVADIEKYITSRTRMIIICNPNNPSGRPYTEEDLKTLHAICEKHGVYLLSDEAYSDYFPKNRKFFSAGYHDPKKNHTIICNSMSKNFSISGWRIGYVITNEELTKQVLKLNQHLITCPATILEHYLVKHFDEILKITDSQIHAVVDKRAEVLKLMDKHGIGYLPGETTFYIFANTGDSSLSSIEFSDKLLDEYKVSTIPGIGYGDSCDKFIRISIGVEPIERIEAGLVKIAQLIKKTSTVLSPTH